MRPSSCRRSFRMSSSSSSSFAAVVDLRRRIEVGFFLLAEEKGEDVVRRREEGFWIREAEVAEEVIRKFDMVVVEVAWRGKGWWRRG